MNHVEFSTWLCRIFNVINESCRFFYVTMSNFLRRIFYMATQNFLHDKLTTLDTIYSDQIDIFCHSDEVVNFDTIANAQTDMICHYDEVVNFDSMADTQIDMIFYYDEVVNFDSIPGNQNDSFVSLFLLFFQNYYFLTFDFEIRGCVMFSNTS